MITFVLVLMLLHSTAKREHYAEGLKEKKER